MKSLTLYVDGASRGNPGDAGVGAIVFDQEQNMVGEISRYIGKTTNNVAEYKALIAGLREVKRFCVKHRIPYRVIINTDSELLLKQLTGEFRVRNAKLIPLSLEAMKLLQGLGNWEIVHIPGKENRRAHNLANLAIDRRRSQR